MSRRDTIIIAVLINAGLLMVLFTTAIRSDKKDVSDKEQIVEMTISQDDLLNQYATGLDEANEEVIFADEMDIPYPSIEAIEEITLPSIPPQEKKRFVNVTVKKGDFLEKIAKANNATVAEILKVNQINPTNLKVGQVLKIPVSEKKSHLRESFSSEEFYIVKDGDNPWLIASRNHIDLDTLLKLNNLDERKAKRLRPGDRLRIR